MEFLACCGAALILLPLILGARLALGAETSLERMAGLLTLKPYITTPIWAILFGLMLDASGKAELDAFQALIPILPGALLSVVTFFVWRVLFERTWRAWTLLLLDCFRWFNSYLMTFVPLEEVRGLLIVISIGMPTIYAVVATNIANEPHVHRMRRAVYEKPKTPLQSEKIKAKPKRQPKPPQLIELADGEIVEVIDADDAPTDWD